MVPAAQPEQVQELVRAELGGQSFPQGVVEVVVGVQRVGGVDEQRPIRAAPG
ncbi:hypothetical protein [Streptomyces lydicus]|uniref:hypothetical protein n=1 Tax=Streptomyces lydicus TaxID=47763 RepID=UPI003430A583